MLSQFYYKPVRFFLLVFLGTWISWLTSAYLSYQKEMQLLQLIMLLIGMLIPYIVALILIFKNKNLKNDFYERLSLAFVNWKYLSLFFLLIPLILFLATSISILLGYSTNQFYLSNQFNLMQGHLVLSIFILFLVPVSEELGWRGYGVDSIRSKFNLFKTSLIFGFLWAIWHLPLFFIKDYYHNQLINLNFVYVINFFVGIFPVAILMNWLFYKSNRSIIAAIILHFTFNLFYVIFQTEQFTKCIMTILLLIFVMIVVIKDKTLFFEK